MLLYFATNTDEKFLGKVKLMKLFYFADFMHIKQYGVPITYDRYVHLDHGPVPSIIMNSVNDTADDQDDSELGDTISINIKPGQHIHRIKKLREFTENEKDYFSDSELDILEKVCKRFYDANAKQIELASHKEAAFSKTNYGDDIPYSLALEDSDCRQDIDKETIELLVQIANF